MARSFALAGLLRVRAIQQDQAAAELAEAHRREGAARRRAVDTAHALGSTVPSDSGDVASWHATISARLALSALLIEHTAAQDAAEAVTVSRTADWAAARGRTRSVERLAERHAAKVQVEEDRAEQLLLDEGAGRQRAQDLT